MNWKPPYNYFVLFCLATLTNTISGQRLNDAQWLLEGSIHLDFSGNDLEMNLIHYFPGKKSPGYTSTTICSNIGELLFYSGGCEIVNSDHVLMMNGDSLNPGSRELGYCKSGYLPWDQCISIIPFPGHVDHYLAFTLDVGAPFELEDTIHFPLVPIHLLFHEININLNDGLGSVLNKNLIAIDDTLSRGYLQAVPHANGRDWWVTVPEWNSNCYYAVLISPKGVQTPIKTCLGLNYGDDDFSGLVHISPDGAKYSRCRGQTDRGLEIFEFDRCSGFFSNVTYLNIPPEDVYSTGVGFSPDSRFLYVTTRTFIWQFDLASDDIQSSIVLVGELLPENAGPGKGTLYQQQIGPDGVIYISSPGSHKYLSTINKPNAKGLDCDFRAHNLAFPNLVNNYRALPNNTIFRLGALDGSTCDTLGIDNIPKANFRYEQDTIQPNEFVFTNLSYFEPETFHWDFGDTSESDLKDPSHIYSPDGIYKVCLFVSNPFGSDTFCRTINLIPTSLDYSLPASNLLIYPNPVDNELNISIKNNSTYPLHFKLFGLDGNLYADIANIQTDNFQINTSSVPDGIYILKMIEKNGATHLTKVVIAHF